MTGSPLRIALVSPHAFPPGDDVGHAVAAEAEALARRGHAVTILAPGLVVFTVALCVTLIGQRLAHMSSTRMLLPASSRTERDV